MIKKILLVDDEQNILDSFSEILASNGYEVESVTSAADCGCMIDESIPDLIIMDINMPGLTGDKAVEFMIHHKKMRHVKFLVVSGYLSDQIMSQLSKWHVPSIAKPVQPLTLLATIKSLERTAAPGVQINASK